MAKMLGARLKWRYCVGAYKRSRRRKERDEVQRHLRSIEDREWREDLEGEPKLVLGPDC